MKFSIKDFFSKRDKIRSLLQVLVTFTEEIVDGKLHFFCTDFYLTTELFLVCVLV